LDGARRTDSPFRRSRFTAYTVHDGLPSPMVRSLCVDSENVLWIGTYDGGPGRFEKGKFTRYTTQDGLFSSGVFQILEDSQGYFWISSNQGIYRVRKPELNDLRQAESNDHLDRIWQERRDAER
jgi:ligand-binding sensor domain-containing protein